METKEKKEAFLFYISHEFPEIQFVDIKDSQKEEVECAVGVNPSACLEVINLLKERQLQIPMINLEDYLNDYITI